MKKILGMLICVMMAIVVVSPVHAEGNATTEVEVDVTHGQTEARSMLEMINAWRTGETWYWNPDNTTKTQIKSGDLNALTYDYDLENIAAKRAVQLAVCFAHMQPDGNSIQSMYSDDGKATTSGENIACGTNVDAAKAFELWQEEDQYYDGQGHRRNMLEPGFKAIGIGHVKIGNIDYWVQEFGYQTFQTEKTDVDDSIGTAKITIANEIIKGLTVRPTGGRQYSYDAGQPIPLPSCNVYLHTEYEGSDNYLPLKNATYSWGTIDPNKGEIKDGTLYSNINLSNETVEYPLVGSYGNQTATGSVDYYIYCVHHDTVYEPYDESYHIKKCAKCGRELGYGSHEFEKTITKEPTSTEEGIAKYTCKDCGYTREEAIAKLPSAAPATSNNKKVKKPSKVSIKSVKNQKGRKIKITWKKTKKAKKYQISYRIKGKKKWTTKTVKGTSYTLKKLKLKKKYQIRIRAINGKTFGAWSKTKTIQIRK